MILRRSDRGLNQPTSKSRGLNGIWACIAFLAGVGTAILIGKWTGEGCGEISGVMCASTVASVRAFWEYKVKGWYYPLVVGWSLIHIFALLICIFYIRPAEARIYISLIWVEYFCFAGLVVFFARFLGDIPECDTD